MRKSENKPFSSHLIKDGWNYYFISPWLFLTEKKGTFFQKISNALVDGTHPVYRGIFAWLLLFLLFFMPAISFNHGRNSDESVSNNYGRDVLNYYLSGGHNKAIFDPGKQGYKHMIYYGLSFDLLCAVVNKYLSPFGEFETRHLLNALFGLLAMFFASFLARKIANWRAALLVLLFMFITPVFIGHSMNNAKDIPFAAGYIMSVFFLVELLNGFPSVRIRNVFFMVIALALTGSNKINGWFILVAYLLIFTAIYWIYTIVKTKKIIIGAKEVKQQFLPLAAIIVFSYFLSIAFWPYAYDGIFTRPLESIKTFENIGQLMIHYELFEGKLMNMAHVPWYYTFKFMLITLPLFVLAGFFVTILCLKWVAGRFKISLIALLVFVTFVPVFYAIYKHSKLYNGWRHFLFIYPSFAVLAALGWEFVFQIAGKKYLRLIAFGILMVFMLKTLAWEISNQPGEVGYFNEMTGGTKGAYSYYEIDPLATTGFLAIKWLAEHELTKGKKVRIMTNIEGGSLDYYAREYGTNINFIWTKGINTSSTSWDYLILISSGMSHKQLTSGSFPPKGTIHTIYIGGAPVIAIVKSQNNFKIKGFRFFNSNQPDSALFYYRKALDFDSNDVEAIDMQAACLINLKRYGESLVCLNKSLNLFPENHFAWENVGAVYMFKDDYPRAITYLRRAVDCRINAKTALLNLGKSYFNIGQPDSSLYFFTEYDKYFPGDVDLYLLVAEVFKRKGDMSGALEVYNKALSLRPNDPNITVLRNEVMNNTTKSVFDDDFKLAMKYAQEGRLDSTISILSGIIHKDHQNYTAWLNRAVAWFQAGDMKKAFADLDTAIKIKPAMVDAWLKKGQIYMSVKNYKSALIQLNTAAKLGGENWEVFQERGNTLFNLGNFQAAYDDYSRSVLLKPDNFRGFYARAIALMNLGDLVSALNDLNQAVVLSPQYLEAYNTRVLVLLKLKKYNEAYDDIQLLKKNGRTVDPATEADVMKNLK